MGIIISDRMRIEHITKKNEELYFELIQNERFANYVNSTVKECSWFNGKFNNYEDYCFTVIIDGDYNIIGQLLVAKFKDETESFISYIWTSEDYRNKGLAKWMLTETNKILPIDKSSSFTKDGYKFLKNIYKELNIFFKNEITFN